ncbi:MAG TPA: hypothetical protein VNK91_13650, partial [Burkholderiaceae bacterium]|nr:hypothetical protein [Burkholderiaceae bacterium]
MQDTEDLSPWQSAAAPVTPFWQRMPKFFLFPAHRAALARIGGAALAYGIAGWIFGRSLPTAPLFGALALLAVTV